MEKHLQNLWLGDFPNDWEFLKIKNIFSERIEKNIGNNDFFLSVVKDVGVVPYSEKGNIGNKTSDKPENYKMVYPGDLVINPMNVKIGSVGVSKYHGCLSTIYIVLNCTIGDPYYYGYIFQIQTFQRFLRTISYGILEIRESVNKDEFFALRLPVPPNEIQKAIVSFLDTKTSQIDALISNSEKKIELLKEKRTALINHVVTKGLDPNVKMKDSGVEWIGEIPEHWGVSKFNMHVNLRHGFQFRDGDFTDEGIKIIKITQLSKDGYLDISNCSFIQPSRLKDFQDILIKKKDILMCLTGGTIGKIIRVGVVNEPLLQNYRVGHFSSKSPSLLSDDYLFRLMSSEAISGQIFYEIRETGQPNIGKEDFSRMRICIPTISEQQEIVKYLDHHTSEIDKEVSLEERRIELLKEYRQSLISEVVTGKINVLDYAN